MLTLSTTTEYGLLFLSSLVGKDGYVSLSKIVKDTGLPKRFLARIAALLVRSGLVESKEGKTGGYRLSSKVKEFSFYDFLRIFEERLKLVKCLTYSKKCVLESSCRHKHIIYRIDQELINAFKKYKLLDVISGHVET